MTRTPAIMLQGTGSDVGKSLIAAGLARHFANQGLCVRPFKPQNMSNNAAVTTDGGEIGRAQALQAMAARVPSSVHMNPVLLKPETSTGAQVIVRGKRAASMSARQFMAERTRFLPDVLESFAHLEREADLIICEGAGSPAEINLRHRDIANMGFARPADVPVILIGDIHRGGVIAAIAGTFAVIDRQDADQIKAFLINKFHGDVSLFADGRSFLEKHTGRRCVGIVPHFPHAYRLPAEDAVVLERAITGQDGDFRIAVPRLSRIANFDDLDPLRLEPGVQLTIVQPGTALPGDADLVILPGSKSTIGDLRDLRANGWDIDIAAHVRRGSAVLGICGGYQMLGRTISDPLGLEGAPETVDGLGLLDVDTVLSPAKTLTNVNATHAGSGAPLEGYEIHLGETTGRDCAHPFAHIDGKPDGAMSPSGRVIGTYLHGCFAGDRFRRLFLADHGVNAANHSFAGLVNQTLDQLADHIAAHADTDAILRIARQRGEG